MPKAWDFAFHQSDDLRYACRIFGHHSHFLFLLTSCSRQTFKDGMDFYFGERSHSARFVDFLEGVVPTKVSRWHGRAFSLSPMPGQTFVVDWRQ